MADSKRGLNLVGTTVADIKNDILGLASAIENQLTPKVRNLVGEFQKMRVISETTRLTASQSRGAVMIGAGGYGGGGFGGNKIAANGAEGNGGGDGQPSETVIAARPSGISRTASVLAGANAVMQTVSNLLPSPATAVRQDLLTAQSAFYGQGGFGGSLSQQSSTVRALQLAMARRGIATNAMDTTNALAAAQSLGLSGATNFNQVMAGAAAASQFAPGIGVTGATQAMGTLNAPTTVNMLRTIGINIRGMDGSVKTIPQIVEDIWKYISQSGTVSLSERDIQVSLMPGNGLYGMLTSIVGSDPTTFTLISNMLLVKARTSGRANLSNMSKSQLQQIGLTTATVNKLAGQTAAQTEFLGQTSSAIAAGYGNAASLGTQLNNLATKIDKLTNVISAVGGVSGGYTGFMGLNNGMMGTLVKSGMGALGGAALGSAVPGIGTVVGALLGAMFMGKANGGDVSTQTPYVVGEKGPELFVPKTDGTIVPNHIFRKDGGGVSAGGSFGASGGKKALTDEQLRSVLTAAGFKGDSLDIAFNVAKAESGGRPGALNPNAKTGDYSMGLFQINMLGDMGKRRNAEYLKKYADIGYTGPQSLYNPAINAAIAYDISKSGTKWTDAWVNTSKKLGLTDANYVSGGAAAASSSSSTTSSLSPAASLTDYAGRIQGLISSAAGAAGMGGVFGGGTSTTYNNGPLTININGAQDPKKVADEVQKIISERNAVRTAGTK